MALSLLLVVTAALAVTITPAAVAETRYVVSMAQVGDDSAPPITMECVEGLDCRAVLILRVEDTIETVDVTIRIPERNGVARTGSAEFTFRHQRRRVGIQQSARTWVSVSDNGNARKTIVLHEYAWDAAIADGSMAMPLVARQPLGVFATVRVAVSPKN